MAPPRMLSPKEVADLFQLNENALRKELRETGSCCGGRVPAVKIGKWWRIRRDAVEAITGPDSDSTEGEA